MIELVATIIILGILAAMAVPSLLRVSNKEQTSATENGVRVVAGAETNYVRTFGAFTVSPSVLASRASGYTYVGPTTASTAPNVASLLDQTTSQGEELEIAALSPSGQCVAILLPAPGAQMSEVTTTYLATATAPCTAQNATTSTGGSW